MKQLAFKHNENSSTTHNTEGNSMASSTQRVVDKDILNLLIAEDLLQILRDMISPFPSKSLTNSLPWNGRTTKTVYIFPMR